MRVLAIATLAIASLTGSVLAALDEGEARHLLVRTGFGAAPHEIERLLPLTREQAVDALLATARTESCLQPPDFCDAPLGPAIATRAQAWKDIWAMPEGPERQKKADEYRAMERKQGLELKSWWWQELCVTDSPLTERMVLFFHNHFTSQLATVEQPRLMYEQNALFRRFALGNYALLLIEVPKDPAMFIYLDSNSNVVGRPNENFAREVMELFTVGEGHYSETDIKEAAKAFTGYKLDHDTGRPTMQDRWHDGSRKKVLGQQGVWDADKIMEILLLAQERVAIHLCEKLWREFVSDAPDAKVVYQWASVFYHGRYEMKPVLRTILLSPQFWDETNRGALVKSPVDILVGTVRTLRLPLTDPQAMQQMGRKLGQDLFEPPNVKGWSGGNAWISSQSLLSRWEVLEDIAKGRLAGGKDVTLYPRRPPAAAGTKPKPDKPRSGAKDTGKTGDGGAMGGGMMAPPTDEPPFAAKAGALTGAAWIQADQAEGDAGLAHVARVLLPLPPEQPPHGGMDAVVKQLLLDVAYNLR